MSDYRETDVFEKVRLGHLTKEEGAYILSLYRNELYRNEYYAKVVYLMTVGTVIAIITLALIYR